MPFSTDFLLLFDEAPGAPVTTSGGVQAQVAQAGTSTFTTLASGTTQPTVTPTGGTTAPSSTHGAWTVVVVVAGTTQAPGSSHGVTTAVVQQDGAATSATSATGNLAALATQDGSSQTSLTTNGTFPAFEVELFGESTPTVMTDGGLAVSVEGMGYTGSEAWTPLPEPTPTPTPSYPPGGGGIGQIVTLRPQRAVETSGGLVAELGPLTGDTTGTTRVIGTSRALVHINGLSRVGSAAAGGHAPRITLDGATAIRWIDPPEALWLLGVGVDDEQLVLV